MRARARRPAPYLPRPDAEQGLAPLGAAGFPPGLAKIHAYEKDKEALTNAKGAVTEAEKALESAKTIRAIAETKLAETKSKEDEQKVNEAIKAEREAAQALENARKEVKVAEASEQEALKEVREIEKNMGQRNVEAALDGLKGPTFASEFVEIRTGRRTVPDSGFPRASLAHRSKTHHQGRR